MPLFFEFMVVNDLVVLDVMFITREVKKRPQPGNYFRGQRRTNICPYLTDLLILDDWGMQKVNAQQRQDLMEVIEDRHGRGSTLIASQLPTEHWHDYIGSATLADAILDRLLHGAHRLNLKGESLRKANAQNAVSIDPS